jgi:hypothetical protein
LLYYPDGSRTFTKKDKKYIFSPAVEKAIKDFGKMTDNEQ